MLAQATQGISACICLLKSRQGKILPEGLHLGASCYLSLSLQALFLSLWRCS